MTPTSTSGRTGTRDFDVLACHRVFPAFRADREQCPVILIAHCFEPWPGRSILGGAHPCIESEAPQHTGKPRSVSRYSVS